MSYFYSSKGDPYYNLLLRKAAKKVFFGANAPLGPALSEGLSVCMSVTL